MRRVSGCDPSLTSTGIAVVTATGSPDHRTFLTTGVVKSDVKQTPGEHPAVYETNRVAQIVEQVCRSVCGSELVLVESPALASRTGKPAERGHLYFSLLAAFTVRGIVFDTVAPTSLKKRVTGSGRAGKDEVLAAVRQAWGAHGWEDGRAAGRYDRADAAALAWLAATTRGFPLPQPGEHLNRAA